jgi:hypothetical protein
MEPKHTTCLMSVDELAAYVGAADICRESGCYNACARGYVCCIECLHGTAEPALPEYVKAKKRLERLMAPSDKD